MVGCPATCSSSTAPVGCWLVEALEHLGGEGVERLKVVLADDVCETTLRLAALEALRRLKRLEAQGLERLATDDGDPAVRAAALDALADANLDAALARAAAVLTRHTTRAATGEELMAASRVLLRDGRPALPGPGRVEASAIQLRAAPDAAAEVAGALMFGARVQALARQGEWLEVETDAARGWAPLAAVALDRPFADEAIAAAYLAWVAPARPRGLPPAAAGGASMMLIETQPPVAETLALALGRLGTPRARDALLARRLLRPVGALVARARLELERERPEARADARVALAGIVAVLDHHEVHAGLAVDLRDHGGDRVRLLGRHEHLLAVLRELRDSF